MRWTGLILIVAIATGCGRMDDDGGAGLAVAASIAPHAWLVEQIAGEAVTVHTVLRPGENPTTLQPDDARVSRVLRTRALFRAGVPFESGAWFDALAGKLEIIDLRAGVPTRTINGHLHPDHAPTAHVAAGSIDPHIWLSPSRLVIQARTVAATLVRIDPAHASGFQTRLEDLVAELEALDSWIAATLSEHQGRSFLVFHPSWGYFADDYGLRQIAIETEGKPPSDAELTEIQHLAKASDISVVFVQPQIAGREARAVADALGAELATLDPLTSDVRATLRRATEAIAASFRD